MPASTNEPPKAKAETKQARYTIINAKTRTVFIQQPYTAKKAANERLAQLKTKFGDQYDLAVVTVDEQGNFQDLPDND